MATARFEEIVEDFEFIDDWEERYRYVIDLGKKMAPLNEGQKIPATKVEAAPRKFGLFRKLMAMGPRPVSVFKANPMR